MSVADHWMILAVVGLVVGYTAGRLYYGRRSRRQLAAVLRALDAQREP
jgi:hypothetical protein